MLSRVAIVLLSQAMYAHHAAYDCVITQLWTISA